MLLITITEAIKFIFAVTIIFFLNLYYFQSFLGEKINERKIFFNITKNKDIQHFDVPNKLDTLINEIIIKRHDK